MCCNLAGLPHPTFERTPIPYRQAATEGGNDRFEPRVAHLLIPTASLILWWGALAATGCMAEMRSERRESVLEDCVQGPPRGTLDPLGRTLAIHQNDVCRPLLAPCSLSVKLSNRESLAAAVDAAAEFLSSRQKPVLVAGSLLRM